MSRRPTELVLYTLDRLQKRFPYAFSQIAPKPQRFEVRDLMPFCHDIPTDLIHKALQYYRSRPAYIEAHINSVNPVDLYGHEIKEPENNQPAEACAATG